MQNNHLELGLRVITGAVLITLVGCSKQDLAPPDKTKVNSPTSERERDSLVGELLRPTTGEDLTLELRWRNWAFERLTWRGVILFPSQPIPPSIPA